MNFKEINLRKILFLDIETVPQYEKYEDLPENWKKLWDKKAYWVNRDDLPEEEFYHRAGIYSEFGKIVCISTAFIHEEKGERFLRIKTFYGDDEKQLLEQFNSMLEKHFNSDEHFLCAHNGKEFDFPYIARRSLVNGVTIPKLLDTHGLKPWQVNHLDTMELWKFGDHKHYTSLELLALLFDLPNPKTEVDGSEVWRLYHKEKDLDTIAEYCENDTITVAQIFLKFRGEKIIPPPNVIKTKRIKD